jgi:hypothetical protein
MSRDNMSLFARALESLLKDTGLFTQREWAKLLGIKDSAITQWLNEETIPRASNLNMVFVTVEQAADAKRGPLEAFRTMADMPAVKASPKNGARMLPSVWAYMKRPVLDELSSKLAKLSPEAQEKLLRENFPVEAATPEKPAGAAATVPSVIKSREPEAGQKPASCPGAATVAENKPHPPEAEGRPLVVTIAHHSSEQSRAPERPRRLRHDYIPPTFEMGPRGETARTLQPSVKWEDITQDSRHVVIVGSPGVGKSSFLTHLRYLLQDRPTEVQGQCANRVPASVPLHNLGRVRTIEHLLGAVGEQWPANMSTDQALIMLDGYDEIHPELRRRISAIFTELRDRYPEIVTIVTSRPTSDLQAFEHWTRCSMQPPDSTRLLAWAYKLATSAKEGIERRWDDAPLRFGCYFRERPDVFGAVSNPLLLSHAARLYANRAVTACHDTELLESCLRYLIEWRDTEKRVVRPSSSQASSKGMFQWLGRLCYRSLAEQASTFTTSHLTQWFSDYRDRTPSEEDLRTAAETTGILEPTSATTWRFANQTFQDYLAARYVVESSRDATEYLRVHGCRPWTSRVLKYACSITPDATPLLRFVLDGDWPSPAAKASTLADMLAQQLTATNDVLEKSCDAVVGWLDSAFAKWTVSTLHEESNAFPEPKWKLAAQSSKTEAVASAETRKHILRSAQAVHRARVSPVKNRLLKRLGVSKNEVVLAIGGSLNVEGYFQGRAASRGDTDVLTAEVCEV